MSLSPTQYYVLAVLALAIVLLLIRAIRYDVVGLLVMVLLIVGGVISPEKALAFIGSATVVVLGSVMVISKVLEESGFLDRLAEELDRVFRNEYVLLLIVMLIVSLLSGFMSDVALVSIFIPFMYAVSRNHNKKLSKYLLPLSYAAIVGGRYTIFGTSTNLIIDQLWYERFGRYLSVFQFLNIGLAIVFISIPALLLIYLLLPNRESVVTSVDDLKIGEYVVEAQVNSDCEFVGKTKREVEREYGIRIRSILPRRLSRTGRIHDGATLIMEVPVDKLPIISSIKGLVLTPQSEQVEGKEVVEALITSSSSLINYTISDLDVLNKYGVRIVGISAGSRRIYGRISHVMLRPGDALLLMGDEESIAKFMSDYGLVPLRTRGAKLFDVRKGAASIAVLAGVTIASLLGVNIALAFLTGVVVLMLSGAVNYRRIYQYIDWSVLIFIASFLSLGYAMSSSGLSTVIAGVIPRSLIVLFLITALIANFVNNVSAAIIMTPIALTYPNPLLAVTVVAMASTTTFLTPFSHPANLLVYNPGNYKPKDYLAMGAVLLILVLIITLLLVHAI
ncbi:SLC13 family permease [Vulcanisaeta distributa]|uniref:TrkA-C domain protein n=1 Tax=Vulcanisaeta distributa (strain DSM 14429 / JCM 11212 / NBRC 100878 / IC-017) TaxID=572478 RepID=E1QRJ5_VULDI|nr:SLC13 family permease [Vulcanisaeta distributa]ADN51809.1 TrkA-C domain protein [Vulcanisaeta distributa DSM 14429]